MRAPPGRHRRRPGPSSERGCVVSIAVACPSCARTGRVPKEFRGKRIKCQACQTRFTLAPEPGAAEGNLPAGEFGIPNLTGQPLWRPGSPPASTVCDLRLDQLLGQPVGAVRVPEDQPEALVPIE
jgi:hypothetical protein